MAFPKLTPKRVLTALGALALAVGTGLQLTRLMYEEPDFEQVTGDGAFEIRRYGSRVVAETFVEAETRREATGEGFRRLAGYIFGGNRDIAMTTPVETEPAGRRIAMTTPVEAAPDDGRWRIAFTMPSEYTVADLPAPDDERVALREVPEKLVASLRFSGSRTDAAKIARLEEELRERLADAGYEATSPITVAVYDPPAVVLPFLRRNELLVTVRERG